MGGLLKYNHFWVDVTKTKHRIKLWQDADAILSEQKTVLVKIILLDKVLIIITIQFDMWNNVENHMLSYVLMCKDIENIGYNIMFQATL